MPFPLLPILAGKLVVAGGIALYGHRAARRLQKIEDYAGATPLFDPLHHLAGIWRGEGLVHGPTGRVVARVAGQMEGDWMGEHGRLRIDMTDENGGSWDETLRLTWDESQATLDIEGDRGQGTGKHAGNALHLARVVTLPDAMGGWTLGANDWLYLLESGAIAQRSAWSKVGIPAAEAAITWTRTV